MECRVSKQTRGAKTSTYSDSKGCISLGMG